MYIRKKYIEYINKNMANVSDMINLLVQERNYTLEEKERQINYYREKYNDSSNQIQDLINQLNDKDNQINNIQNLLNYYKGENQNLQTQLQNEINSKNELENKLRDYNNQIANKDSIISSLNNTINENINKNQINNKKIIDLMNTVNKNEEEIKKLNLIIKVTNGYDKLKEPISITFNSTVPFINYKINCHHDDIFSEIEEKLYQIFPSLKEGNNIFLCNGRKIENSQSILSNEITNDSIILINSEF